ncbi:MAG: hypothetical protein K9M84_05275 [Spirochaetia bacterium]|nr:hypothetical protein [Spirochaetia bacterium]MCF7941001.1 hypothetical protein [Spirochaetia bacterium]
METISSCVKRIIDKKPFLIESMTRGIVSYGNLSDMIGAEIEASLGKPIKHSAVVMALRRYGEELRERSAANQVLQIQYELLMKTNIYDLNLVKTTTLLEKIKRIYHFVSLERGDFLNITVGNNEVSIAISSKYKDQLHELIADEQILHRLDDMVALTVIFSGDFLHTPGVIYEAVRKLSWNNINVYEIVSTINELTFVIERTDSINAYEVLQSFL